MNATATIDTIDREICLALGLWKEGEKCVGTKAEGIDLSDKPGMYFYCDACKSNQTKEPHDIPPPDLLSDSGFVLLLGALLAKGATVKFNAYHGEVVARIYDLPDSEQRGGGTGPDAKVALRAAAHQLLCPKEATKDE